MARKTKETNENENIIITEQKITDTLEVNYMPYAMSVIVSRAIPEIDGFKPSHRKTALYHVLIWDSLRGQGQNHPTLSARP